MPQCSTIQGSTPLVDVPLSFRLLLLSTALTLAACKPPASDDYLARVDLAEAKGAVGEPLPSPDTTGAVWANGETSDRILFGFPGETPFLALECERNGGLPQIRITRFAAANAQAKALFALIGNGHIARFPVDAEWNGRAWLWEGTVPADEPDLDVLTGKRTVAATLPGAGRLELNHSPLTGALVEACRATPDSRLARPLAAEAGRAEAL